jgi:hypothetical protein
MKNSNQLAQYRNEWVISVMGEKEPYILNDAQYEALKEAVAQGRNIVFFKEFAIGTTAIRSTRLERIAIVDKTELVPIDENGNPIEI